MRDEYIRRSAQAAIRHHQECLELAEHNYHRAFWWWNKRTHKRDIEHHNDCIAQWVHLLMEM